MIFPSLRIHLIAAGYQIIWITAR